MDDAGDVGAALKALREAIDTVETDLRDGRFPQAQGHAVEVVEFAGRAAGAVSLLLGTLGSITSVVGTVPEGDDNEAMTRAAEQIAKRV